MAVQPLSPATDRRLGRPLPHQLSNRTRAHLCAIKSLAFNTCESNALYGISGRFQTLFRSHRQIAHALLTRPPLIRSRSSLTVRLECVKHAASVHPEPGSNSLKNGILNSSSDELKIFFRAIVLSFFYFSTLCFKVIDKNLFVLFSSVVQFSRTVLRLSFRALM